MADFSDPHSRSEPVPTWFRGWNEANPAPSQGESTPPRQDPADLTPSTHEPTRGARFHVLRPHARGAMGIVSVAMDEELGREVALKELAPECNNDVLALSRFIREAEVTGRLEHPGIVPVYGLGLRPDGQPYYAMRLIEGEGLDRAIQRLHRMENRDAQFATLRGLLQRFVAVCNAVGFAHVRGVIHRDLKPANVLLGPFGETLVVDWGLARFLDGRDGHEEIAVKSGVSSPSSLPEASPASTAAGVILGTPAYMSPEQASGEIEQLGPTSDVYSLGATLYHLLVGAPPFGAAPGDTLLKVRMGEFIAPRKANRGIPAALEAIILKAMRHASSQRYPTALALAADIEAWLADMPVEAYPEPITVRLRRWAGRHRTLVVGASVLLATASLALTISLFLVSREQSRTQEALERSLRAEKSASEQRQLALDTVRNVAFAVDEKLKDRPDMQALRIQLHNRALEGLQRVARETDTAGRIDHDQFKSQIELGDLFRVVEMGGTASAHTQYERALTVAKRYLQENPDNPQARHDLCLAHDKLGEILLQKGDTTAARASYQTALEGYRKLLEGKDDDEIARWNVSGLLVKLGRVDLAQGQTREAITRLRESLTWGEKLADREGADRVEARVFALDSLVEALLQTSQQDEAQGPAREALVLAEKRLEAQPQSQVAKRRVLVALGKVGDVQLRRQDLDRAAETFGKQLHLAQQLANAAPNSAQARYDLAHALQHLAEAETRRGALGRALPLLTQTRDLCWQLASGDASNAQALRNLAVACERLGDLRLTRRDQRRAQVELHTGVEAAQRLLDLDPRSVRAQRDLATLQCKLGDTYQMEGRIDKALSYYHDALRLRIRVSDKDPGNPTTSRELITSLERVGNSFRLKGSSKEARRVYNLMAGLMQRLLDSNPGDQLLRQDQVITMERLGHVAQLEGNLDEARASFAKAVALARAERTRDPANTEMTRILTICLNRLGQIASAQKDYQMSLTAIQEAEALIREVIKANRQNLNAALVQTATRQNLALAQMRLHDYPTALATIKEMKEEMQRPDRVAFLGKFLPEIDILEQRCQVASQAIVDPSCLLQAPPGVQTLAFSSAFLTLLDRQDRERLRQALALAPRLQGPRNRILYLAGCAHAHVTQLPLSPQERAEHEHQVLAYLSQAVNQGYQDVNALRTQPELTPLRAQPHLRAAFEELERRAVREVLPLPQQRESAGKGPGK